MRPRDLEPTSIHIAARLNQPQWRSRSFFAHEGKYDLVWDVTFLCALDPSVREQWAAKHRALLNPSGQLITGVFPICDKCGGPPYAMSVELVRSLLTPAGLAALEIRETLPDAEQHRPGGFQGRATVRPQDGGPRTAVAIWQPAGEY